MNPTILLIVALISLMLNAWYMGKLFLLKKLHSITFANAEVTYRLGFKYYVLYMNKKLDGEIPKEHLAKTYETIVLEETISAEIARRGKNNWK